MERGDPMGRASRSKGQRGERALAAWLRERGYPEARRGLSQSSGARECDVEGTEWWLEVKSGIHAEKRVKAACAQALRDTDGRPCAVVWRSQAKARGTFGPWTFALALCEAEGEPDTSGVVAVCRAGEGVFAAHGWLWVVSRGN